MYEQNPQADEYATKRDVSSCFEAKKQPKDFLWNCKCKGCGLLLGYNYDMRDDAVCWDKKKADAEEKQRVKNEGPEPTREEIDAFLASLPECDPEAECRAYLDELEAKHQAQPPCKRKTARAASQPAPAYKPSANEISRLEATRSLVELTEVYNSLSSTAREALKPLSSQQKERIKQAIAEAAGTPVQ